MPAALSMRLSGIARLVPDYGLLADIGSDHGLLAQKLLAERPGLEAVVTDISPKSLSKARSALKSYEERVRLIVADGLLFGEDLFFDRKRSCVVIAGMGGHLIRRILEEGFEKRSKITDGACFVLQPNTEPEAVRAWLDVNGMVIDAEDCVFEAGHYYQIIRAAKGSDPVRLTPDEILYGPILLSKRHPVMMEFLAHRVRVIGKILEDMEKGCGNVAKAGSAYISVQNHIREILAGSGYGFLG